MSQGNPRATPSTRPVGALMRIEEAAKELGLEVVDLLEYAQDRGDGGPVLRVCMATPDGLDVEPGLLAHLPMSITDPHARIYRVVLASTVPAFFDILARDGERTLGDEDRQSRIEDIRSKKSLLFATPLPDAAIRVRLKGLKVLREDVERLKTHLRSDGATMPEVALGADTTEPTGKRNARWVGIAKTLVKNDPGHFLDSNGKPVWKRLAEELERQGHAKGLKTGTLRDILRDNWGS